jgi:mannose-6-phosphate isomerase-like protein (cupin superfamily)
MNSVITTLDPSPITTQTKTLLSQEGFTCSLILLAPGGETPRYEAEQTDEHILYVAEGRVVIRFGDVNTILDKDQSLLVSKGRDYVIAAHADQSAKILRVAIPPRQVLTPPIITLSS